jgi:basic amino acid/polyamine antiporter, APA family
VTREPSSSQPASAGSAYFGLWSGVGLVVANMIGVGVLTSNGYMVKALSPSLIFLVWIIQGVLAIAGARAYAGIAATVPGSGGEYRYLSDLLHPSLGCLAGWTSLLVGFAAPVAANAYASGLFLKEVAPDVFGNARVVAAGLIILVTAFQVLDMRTSKWSQDVLVLLKAALFAAFILIGVVLGANRIPEPAQAAPATGFPMTIFITNLFYAAYAYSGWNAAIYAAGEFRDARRTVPRAMVIGAALVTLAYLAITWVFVANLSPGDISLDNRQATVAHLIVNKLIGKAAAAAVSIGIVIILVSAMSAMTLLGPRVNAAMARDGFLPRVFAGREGRPPVGSVLLQAAIALGLLFLNSFAALMQNVGVVLTFSSALTVLGLFRLQAGYKSYAKPGFVAVASGVLFFLASCWTLYMSFKLSPRTIIWVAAICAITAVAYIATQALRRKPASSSGSF